MLALETELRTLEKHSGANEKISQQRRDLWKAESQYAVLHEKLLADAQAGQLITYIAGKIPAGS
ncbi:minor tail protein H domain protein [Escherichia coli O91:H21 str. B2F1]|nr:minor tail protein H domain protein [Escherichia coli O91:H21 str. B2F1]